MNFYLKLKSKIRIFFLRCRGMKIGKKCFIGDVSIIGLRNISIGDNVHIEDNVRLKATNKVKSANKSKYSLIIEDNVFLGYSTVLDSNLELRIGKNCMIGPLCFFTDSNHIHKFNDIPIIELGGDFAATKIQENCWFGVHCSVLKGVNVSKNSVFGANTTVLKSTEESSLYIGTPAKKK